MKRAAYIKAGSVHPGDHIEWPADSNRWMRVGSTEQFVPGTVAMDLFGSNCYIRQTYNVQQSVKTRRER